LKVVIKIDIPTSIVEKEPDHEMMYVFKDKGGTYNPQKAERDKDYKHSGKRSSAEHYGDELKCKSLYKKEDGKHPTSIVEKEPDHEMMYVFKDKGGTYNPQKTEGKPYKAFKTKNGKEIGEVYGGKSLHNENKGDRHPTSIVEPLYKDDGRTIKTVYGETPIINKTDSRSNPDTPRHPTSIVEKEAEMMYVFKDKQGTYNPQKIKDEKQKRDWTKTKPIKCDGVYGKVVAEGAGINEGYRHPTSVVDDITIDVENTVLDFKSVNKTVHKTQKPVDLCEWLIKSYSNEGDTVMDFCMGSGTTGVACKNTKRKFIGVELDKEIFEVAKERIR
jgi:adenine specific DNA methylase Mod